MLCREAQVHRERGQIVGDAGDRGGVAGLANVEEAQKSAFTWDWSWAGTLASTLRARWTRHRCRRLAGNARSKAPVRPAAPSLMPSSGAPRPRPIRSARKSSQASVDSDAAGVRPTNTGLPSVSMPQAARTGSAGAPGCVLKWLASRNRWSSRTPDKSRVVQAWNSSQIRWQMRLTVDFDRAASAPSTSAKEASMSRSEHLVGGTQLGPL
jgi:hypothetical protein